MKPFNQTQYVAQRQRTLVTLHKEKPNSEQQTWQTVLVALYKDTDSMRDKRCCSLAACMMCPHHMSKSFPTPRQC